MKFLTTIAKFFGYVPAAAVVTGGVDQRSADKAKLVELLSDARYEFRTLNRLMRGINTTNETYTRALLSEIGTRTEYRDHDLFGLKSRVGNRARRRQEY